MDLSTTSLILTGLVTIVFLVAVILSYKTWKVYTVLLVLLNFMAAVCFFYYAVRTLKTHQQWREAAALYEAGIESYEKANIELVEGARDEDGKLLREGIEWNDRWLHYFAITRGRVWEECLPGAVEASGAVSVTIPGGGDHIEIAAATDKEGKDGKAEVVYVFEEATGGDTIDDTVDDTGRYLGEFNIVKKVKKEIDDDEVIFDLVPTRKMYDFELARLQDSVKQSERTWVIHAVMPEDNPLVFSRLSLLDGKPKFTIFDNEQLRALAPKKGADESDDDYQKFVDAWVDAYSRDGTVAGPNDPPERKLVRVRFIKSDHTMEVEHFHRMPITPGGTVKFELGVDYGFGKEWQMLVDYKTYEELGPNGTKVVSRVSEVYSRKLQDFQQLYRISARQWADISKERATIRLETSFVVASKKEVLARLTARKTEQQRLEEDDKNFKIELAGVKAYRELLEGHRTDVRKELGRLFKENQALAKELGQLQLAAKRRLEGKTSARSASLQKKAAPGF